MRANAYNCRRLRAALAVVVLFSAVIASPVGALAKGTASHEPAMHLPQRTPEIANVVDAVCNEILKGNLETARELILRSKPAGNAAIEQLNTLVDEYAAIKARRQTHQDDAYRTNVEALEKLDIEGLPDGADNIAKVFSILAEALEGIDGERRQALLEHRIVKQAVDSARTMAAQLESEGKWLKAYRVCYRTLADIYQDDEAYSNHAELLLKKAEIMVSLEDSSCETCQERYEGVEKQSLVDAVNILDSHYVSLVNYRRMATKGLARCILLGELTANSNFSKRHGLTDSHLTAWSNELRTIAGETDRSPGNIDKDAFIAVFEEVLATSKNSNGRTGFPQELLIAHFAEAALTALDPHTDIYWPSRVKDLQKAIKKQFSGIGITFLHEAGQTKVKSVLPGTPAHQSGLEAGDIIREVDGVQTQDASSDCVVAGITGPEGTRVTLTLRRPGDNDVHEITIKRARIVVPTIHGWQRNGPDRWSYMIDERNKIGYVRISSFASNTAEDFENAIDQLNKNDAKGMVLDLRSNGGGLLNSAVEIADRLIKKGLIVRIQPRFSAATYMAAHKDETDSQLKVAVLINDYTASASEIMAGALQDPKHDRATLVGQRSYGKGSVQSITNLPGNQAQLKYTMAYYHLPSGQRVGGKNAEGGKTPSGIRPDVSVRLRQDERRRISEIQTANESFVKTDPSGSSTGTTHYSSQQTIDADPQLAVALLVLKSQMIQSGPMPSLD